MTQQFRVRSGRNKYGLPAGVYLEVPSGACMDDAKVIGIIRCNIESGRLDKDANDRPVWVPDPPLPHATIQAREDT